MLSHQREDREVMIESDPGVPGGFVVATAANSAQLACVRIVIDVAITAGGRQKIFQCADMTRRASGGSVRPGEPETGFQKMIEARTAPVHGAVAIGTAGTVVALVNIFVCMAGMAGAALELSRP